jgi:hypothetical protein
LLVPASGSSCAPESDHRAAAEIFTPRFGDGKFIDVFATAAGRQL